MLTLAARGGASLDGEAPKEAVGVGDALRAKPPAPLMPPPPMPLMPPPLMPRRLNDRSSSPGLGLVDWLWKLP